MLSLATPALKEPMPMAVLPSLKVTVPVAALGLTVAVSVVALPMGTLEAVSVTVVLVAVRTRAWPAKRLTTRPANKLNSKTKRRPVPARELLLTLGFMKKNRSFGMPLKGL